MRKLILKLGKSSQSEEMQFRLTESMDSLELTELLNNELPDGIKIIEIDEKIKS